MVDYFDPLLDRQSSRKVGCPRRLHTCLLWALMLFAIPLRCTAVMTLATLVPLMIYIYLYICLSEASLRPARARRPSDRFGTDCVRSMLPSLYVPVRPLLVLREASRGVWRSISRSTMVVIKMRTSLSVGKNLIGFFLVMYRANDHNIFDIQT